MLAGEIRFHVHGRGLYIYREAREYIYLFIQQKSHEIIRDLVVNQC